jgi:hypothetical protein
MRKLMIAIFAAALVAVPLSLPSPAIAQGVTMSPAPGAAAKPSKEERAAARAAAKAKRADCKRQAKEQKLGFMKSRSYVKDCMKKTA